MYESYIIITKMIAVKEFNNRDKNFNEFNTK